MHRICPQCHSDRMLTDLFLITGHYKCMDCGYEGAFIITMDDDNYERLLEEDKRERGDSSE